MSNTSREKAIETLRWYINNEMWAEEAQVCHNMLNIVLRPEKGDAMWSGTYVAPRARWIAEDYYNFMYCSKCKGVIYNINGMVTYSYCPHCGCYMR